MLLPLVPSAHPSTFSAGGDWDERRTLCLLVLRRDRHLCRFCGLPAGDWQDVFNLNHDHADWSEGNLAAACPLCHAVQHIGAITADREMRVIWLPEVTQNVLNVLVRGIHLALLAGGVPPTLDTRPILDDVDLGCAWRAYAALDRRAGAALGVVDSRSPRDLAAGLRALSPAHYANRVHLLGGLRLLHRGRRLRRGRDTYPDQLSAWAALAGTADPPIPQAPS